METSKTIKLISLNDNHKRAINYLHIPESMVPLIQEYEDDCKRIESLGMMIKTIESSNRTTIDQLIPTILISDNVINTWSKTHLSGFLAIYPKRFGLKRNGTEVKYFERVDPVAYVHIDDDEPYFQQMLLLYKAGRVVEEYQKLIS
jgi:hypothetical protein